MIFELWKSNSENSQLFIPRNECYEIEMKKHKEITPDQELVWTCEARSYFEAMQKYYDHMGWGKYKPEPDWEDIIYE